MKCSQLTHLALGAIAAAGLITNFATAQELGGVAGKSSLHNQIQQQVQGQVQQQVQAQVHEQTQLRVQAQLQSQVQGQVQQQIQSQLQSQAQAQLRAQAQGQMSSQVQLRADAARAGIMAQHAIDDARHQAKSIRGQTGDGGVAARANEISKFQSIKGKPLGALTRQTDQHVDNSSNDPSGGLPQIKGKPLGALTRRADGLLNNPSNLPPGGPSGGLPRGFVESDVKIYDAVFGSFNPFRGNAEQASATESNAQVDAGTNSRIATEWQSDRGVAKATAYSEVDLATRIDLAVHHRRAEISAMRDKAMAASNEAMMEQAEQMEQVLDLFVQARAQAAVGARAQTNAEDRTRTQRGLPVIRNPNPSQIGGEQEPQIQSSGNPGGNGG